MASCSVCIYPFDSTTKKRTVCHHCNFEACKECCLKHIMGSSKEATCMECQKLWSRTVLVNNFSATWVASKDGYRAHEKKLLVERERLLLRDSKEDANVFLANAKADAAISIVKKQKQTLEIELRSLKREETELRAAKDKRIRDRAADARAAKKMKATIACAVVGCLGECDATGQCKVCECKVCASCHVAMQKGTEASHKCDENIMASVAAIEESTKPCPECTAPVFRTEGCMQMWCTQCRTFFSWATGEALEGEHHNPHYIEWREKQGTANNNDGPCRGEAITSAHARVLPLQRNWQSHPDTAKFAGLSIALDFFARYSVGCVSRAHWSRRDETEKVRKALLGLRVQFILERIDESTWGEQICARTKASELCFEVLALTEAWGLVVQEMLRGYSKHSGKLNWKAAIDTLDEIFDYTEKAAVHMARTKHEYGSASKKTIHGGSALEYSRHRKAYLENKAKLLEQA